jgi:prealbumin domain-containing protein
MTKEPVFLIFFFIAKAVISSLEMEKYHDRIVIIVSFQRLVTTPIVCTIFAVSILVTVLFFGASMYTRAAPSPRIDQVQGTLIVSNNVINEGVGDKKPSDFVITVHGNDASPSSFQGNSSGTPVTLHMGMYSVTETRAPGYNLTLSGDCSGGVMTVETKRCIITNIYSKPIGIRK